MLSYPSAITLSTRTLTHLADLIRARHRNLRSRWRRLDPGRQALLALAHLRNGDTCARLAAGFGVGMTTAWRYLREAVDLLAPPHRLSTRRCAPSGGWPSSSSTAP